MSTMPGSDLVCIRYPTVSPNMIAISSVGYQQAGYVADLDFCLSFIRYLISAVLQKYALCFVQQSCSCRKLEFVIGICWPTSFQARLDLPDGEVYDGAVVRGTASGRGCLRGRNGEVLDGYSLHISQMSM